MLELYSKVFVNDKKIIGTIIDIEKVDNELIYTVESDKNTEDKFGTLYPLLYCKENEIKEYKPSK